LPKESGRKVVATNRKARHDYHVLDTYEAGIALMGTEVKSLREGHASMVDGFCTFYNDELWMEAIHIPEYNQGSWTNHAARRRRKLLLHREELIKISHKVRSSRCSCTSLMAKPRWKSVWRAVSASTTNGRPSANSRTTAKRSGKCGSATAAARRE
jgi:SsrA-binding protein